MKLTKEQLFRKREIDIRLRTIQIAGIINRNENNKEMLEELNAELKRIEYELFQIKKIKTQKSIEEKSKERGMEL